MSRPVLDAEHIHPAIRDRVEDRGRSIIDEVERGIKEHKVLVVGMGQNPHVKKARNALKAAGIKHGYLEYGSYLPGAWRQRTTLKMWTGWHTFPMVFVEGIFVGGASDLIALLAAGEFDGLKG